MLSKKTIAEFQQIYLMEIGEKISEPEAQKLGKELLDFVRLIYRPIPKDLKTDNTC